MPRQITAGMTTREIRTILYDFADQDAISPYLMAWGYEQPGLTIREQRIELFNIAEQDEPCPFTFTLIDAPAAVAAPAYEARIPLNGRFQFLARSTSAARARAAAETIVTPEFHDEIEVKTADEWVGAVSSYNELKSIFTQCGQWQHSQTATKE